MFGLQAEYEFTHAAMIEAVVRVEMHLTRHKVLFGLFWRISHIGVNQLIILASTDQDDRILKFGGQLKVGSHAHPW